MKHIETDFIHISILDNKTVLVEAMDEVEINLEKSKYANSLIENEMENNYGMIINRKADYSIVPIDVYNVLNEFKRLKAIAIVVHDKRNFLPIDTEKNLFNGELDVFYSIQQAHLWLNQVVNE
ncbi:MAG: hypothetical protein OEW99_13955 [Gammaproteobacteria bacterium]|nr:hypothetical protein [Gammaproteobacteria bacterium]MDH5371126.1 hypothetical protein [Gammaproteobacteria bacterium]MDH5660258.1 hypothetical protein [Gammaproteobacteria bacterium]